MACGDYGFRDVDPKMFDPGVWLFRHLALLRPKNAELNLVDHSLERAVQLALRDRCVPEEFRKQFYFLEETHGYPSSEPVEDMLHNASSEFGVFERNWRSGSYHEHYIFQTHLAEVHLRDAPEWFERFAHLVDLHLAKYLEHHNAWARKHRPEQLVYIN